MKIEFLKTNKIQSIKDWECYAPPKDKDKHWKPGRSAYSMADFAINNNENFKKVITDILKDCKIDIQDFECEPEATAGLGRGMQRGGPRNHDLLMVGKNCVIGIEAKVSETFDRKWGFVQNKQSKKQGNDNTRASELRKFLTPDKPDNVVNDIGYQLFTATRGTMISAMKAGFENAVLLVIVFEGKVELNICETDEKYNKVVKNNDDDLAKFLCAIGAKEGKIRREIEGKTINCWIKKVKIRIPDYTIVK